MRVRKERIDERRSCEMHRDLFYLKITGLFEGNVTVTKQAQAKILLQFHKSVIRLVII